jgi:hypothetical protein
MAREWRRSYMDQPENIDSLDLLYAPGDSDPMPCATFNSSKKT